jgi:hypothetical protein
MDHIITVNTSTNEPLREGALGLTFLNGASYTSNIGNQIYHSAQFVLSHRFQAGLFMQTSYTYGKNIDNGSGAINTDELNSSTGRGGAGIYNNQSNPSLNRALSDLDRRHRLSIAYAYELPVPHSGIFGSQLFQGWGLTGLVTLQSGQVFGPADSSAGLAYGGVLATPLANCGNLADPPGSPPSGLPTCTAGAPTNAASLITPGGIEKRLNHYINPNFVNFTVPVANGSPDATGFGSPGFRNAFRGPFQSDVDFSITKAFHISERYQLLLRADAFNLFNHPVFSIPTCATCLDINSSVDAFGRIDTTVIPYRLLQLGLKFSF